LLESQNITLFLSFLEKLEYKAEQDILSAKRIINSEHYEFIKKSILRNSVDNYTHPKIQKVFSIISEELDNYRNAKMIIFTQYREMAELLKDKIKQRFGTQLHVEKFIGQASKINDLGFSQDQQIEIIKRFKNGAIDILIATSVAEEGLDIPNVDAIIFYEPVPSEIRLIQRRGRTGRHAPGRCYLLIARETIDVPFYKAADKKESAMHWVLSHPKELDLSKIANREKICFKTEPTVISELDIIQKYRERRDKEKEFLANRSVEEIISELDNFVESNEYKQFKDSGVTFYSDVMKLDEINLKRGLLKMKGANNGRIKKANERKNYLNKNLKTLIRIAKTYSVNGKIQLSEFKELAQEEEIIEKKFYTHFNQACHLGYLKRSADEVEFIMDYD
jgi:Fanconi anemia group M protein